MDKKPETAGAEADYVTAEFWQAVTVAWEALMLVTQYSIVQEMYRMGLH